MTGPRKPKPRRRPAGGAPPGSGQGEAFVLARHAGARIGDGDVVVANLRTSARDTFPGNAAPLLEAFLEPQPLADALRRAAGREASDLVAAAEQIARLLALGVLVPLREESGPGPAPTILPPGWAAAADFIARTRTAADIRYLDAEEMGALLASDFTRGRQPSCFRDFEEAPFLDLPAAGSDDIPAGAERGFAEILLARRTARRYDDRPLPATLLGTILRLVWGASDRVPNPLGDYFLRKTSPSGGALHPVEVYPIVRNVEGIPAGAYHYSVRRHGLEQLSAELPDGWITDACGGQAWIEECPVVFLSTGFLPRSAWKYDFSRAFRVVMADAGHVSQSLGLVATWLGLGAFTTAALRDAMFEEMLGLDPLLEPPLLVNGVGFLEAGAADSSRPRYEGADAPVSE